MDTVKRWRLEYINYGLKESNKRFKESILSKSSLAINASLSEVLFWINAADELHCKETKDYRNKRKNEIGGQYIMGLRHVFNSLKHNMSFIKPMRPTGGKEFIKGLDIQVEDYSTETVWAYPQALPPKYLNRRALENYETNLKNYKKFVEGKNIVTTFEESILFLDDLYREVRRSEHIYI